jgi:hypothetical protein
MAGKKPKEKSDQETTGSDPDPDSDSDEPIYVTKHLIGDFKAAGGDYRSNTWTLTAEGLQIFKRNETGDESTVDATLKTVRSWTLGTGKNKKSCLVFNEELVVARELFDAERSTLECKKEVINLKVKGPKAAGNTKHIFVITFVLRNSCY